MSPYSHLSSSSAFDVMTELNKSSGPWLLESLPPVVVRQLAPGASCRLQCLLARTVGVLSLGAGRSEECVRSLLLRATFQVVLWFVSSSEGRQSGLSVGHIHYFSISRLISASLICQLSCSPVLPLVVLHHMSLLFCVWFHHVSLSS